MSVTKILNDWKKKSFKPVYWFEGEEDFYIDQLVDAAEHTILSEAEAGFNLSVFYGKDAAWSDVVNACMRYPMFSDKQVVILKEAQQMKDIDKLEGYINNPLASTIFVVGHKEKKVDGRSKLAKLLKKCTIMNCLPGHRILLKAKVTSQHKKQFIYWSIILATISAVLRMKLTK